MWTLHKIPFQTRFVFWNKFAIVGLEIGRIIAAAKIFLHRKGS